MARPSYHMPIVEWGAPEIQPQLGVAHIRHGHAIVQIGGAVVSMWTSPNQEGSELLSELWVHIRPVPSGVEACGCHDERFAACAQLEQSLKMSSHNAIVRPSHTTRGG
jgi:hypothetical protein